MTKNSSSENVNSTFSPITGILEVHNSDTNIIGNTITILINVQNSSIAYAQRFQSVLVTENYPLIFQILVASLFNLRDFSMSL